MQQFQPCTMQMDRDKGAQLFLTFLASRASLSSVRRRARVAPGGLAHHGHTTGTGRLCTRRDSSVAGQVEPLASPAATTLKSYVRKNPHPKFTSMPTDCR